MTVLGQARGMPEPEFSSFSDALPGHTKGPIGQPPRIALPVRPELP